MFQDQNNRPKKVMVILVVSYFIAILISLSIDIV